MKRKKKKKEEIVEENLQPSSQSAPILSTVGKKKHFSYEYTCPISYVIIHSYDYIYIQEKELIYIFEETCLMNIFVYKKI